MNQNPQITQDSLQCAGIPVFLVQSRQRTKSITDLRIALCYILNIVCKIPQRKIAELLNMCFQRVSKSVADHYDRYVNDEEYRSVYNSAIEALKNHGLI